jgi:hypothetical protein
MDRNAIPQYNRPTPMEGVVHTNQPARPPPQPAKKKKEPSPPPSSHKKNEIWTCHKCGKFGMLRSTNPCTNVLQYVDRYGTKGTKPCSHARCEKCEVSWTRPQ